MILTGKAIKITNSQLLSRSDFNSISSLSPKDVFQNIVLLKTDQEKIAWELFSKWIHCGGRWFVDDYERTNWCK